MDLHYAATQNSFSRLRALADSRTTQLPSEITYVVVDDALLRESVTAFLNSEGFDAIAFASAAECLERIDPAKAVCVILNVRFPNACGLELQQQLKQRGVSSIIFLYDHCDIHSAVRGMKAGALEFLAAPVDFGLLEAAVRRGQAKARRQRQADTEISSLKERMSLLTPREREVLSLVVSGLLNKQAASILGITEATLQVHRCRVMTKMAAGSFAELVRMAIKLRVPYPQVSQLAA